MSRGMTLADFVQQVYYAIYKVRLDTAYSDELPEAFHADTDKFKEVIMEGNMVLAELQKEQDWNWLRDRLRLGTSEQLTNDRIMEFVLPDDVYKPCMGYNDAVRLIHPDNPQVMIEIPYTQARSGSAVPTAMFDEYGQANVPDTRLRAFLVGNVITFNRPFRDYEVGWAIETDVIRAFDELHICGAGCSQPCDKAYVDKVFTEIPDPYYMVVRTATKRAEGDPGAADRVMSLENEAKRLLSSMRSNDSSKTFTDSYTTVELGHIRVL